MSSRASAGRSVRPRELIGPFAFGTLLGAVLLIAMIQVAQPPPEGGTGYVRTFSPPRDGFEVLLLHGDGQAYAQVALDPGLREPGAWVLGAPQLAFFAQRPLLPYAASVLSLGDRDGLPRGFVLVGALGAGLLVAATGALFQVHGRRATVFLVTVLLIPNVVVAISALGPDLLGPALALLGLACWRGRPARVAAAVALLALAGLARESMLLVAVVLAVVELVRDRRPWREVAPLALTVVPYAGWLVFVRLRVHAGAEEVATAASFSAPFVGIWQAMGGWASVDLVMVALLVGTLLVVGIWARRTVEGVIILAYVAGSTVLNPNVWRSWTEIGRILIPATVLAVVVLATNRPARLPFLRARL